MGSIECPDGQTNEVPKSEDSRLDVAIKKREFFQGVAGVQDEYA